MNLYNEPFPRAILHVDGDSFFVACELTKRPELKGLPVVTGSEKGIASAMSIEAKAAGITRGMPIHLMKKACPAVVIIPSDFSLYQHYSHRMSEIMKRYTSKVETYSIDECFVDITGLNEQYHLSYREIAERIKKDLELELGITFSVGVSTTKTLAKTASFFSKPAGLTVIAPFEISHYLSQVPIEEVWGIGKRTSLKLKGWGVHNALELTKKDDRWLTRHFSKPVQEIVAELKGMSLFAISDSSKRDYLSVSKTQSLSKPTQNKELLFSELSRNVERACRTLRARKMFGTRFSIFIKTQSFEYEMSAFELDQAVAHPGAIMKQVRAQFNTLFKSGVTYRATGITVSQLTHSPGETLNLFGENEVQKSFNELYEMIDATNTQLGRGTIMLGSSIMSQSSRLWSEKLSRRARLNIPSLGFVY